VTAAIGPLQRPTLPQLRARLALAAREFDSPAAVGSLGLHVVFGCLLLMMPRPSLEPIEKPPTVVMVDLPPIVAEPPEPPPPKPSPKSQPTLRMSKALPPMTPPQQPPAPALKPTIVRPTQPPLTPRSTPRLDTAVPQLRLPEPTTVTASQISTAAPQNVLRAEPLPQATLPTPTEVQRSEISRTSALNPNARLDEPLPGLSLPQPTVINPTAAPNARSSVTPGPGAFDAPLPGLAPEPDVQTAENDERRRRAEAEALAAQRAALAQGGDAPLTTAGSSMPRGGGGGGPVGGGGAPPAGGGGQAAVQGFAVSGLEDGPGNCTNPDDASLTDAQRAACNLRWRGVRGLSAVAGRNAAQFESDLAAKMRGPKGERAVVACKSNLGGECLPDKP
jgi:hypothetical protein